jgi:hypothetical protein
MEAFTSWAVLMVVPVAIFRDLRSRPNVNKRRMNYEDLSNEAFGVGPDLAR